MALILQRDRSPEQGGSGVKTVIFACFVTQSAKNAEKIRDIWGKDFCTLCREPEKQGAKTAHAAPLSEPLAMSSDPRVQIPPGVFMTILG
jgi:hypothetical protein